MFPSNLIGRVSRTGLVACVLFTGLSMHGVTAAQEADAPKPAAGPKKPQKGRFEVRVETEKVDKTYTVVGRAMPIIARTAALQKRKPDDVAFRATLILNSEAWEFRSADDARNACLAVLNASRRLARVKLGLGDLDGIPEVAANVAGTTGVPMNPQAELRRRINEALARQMQPRPGQVRAPMPNPLQIQRTIQQEIQKARDEGLIGNNVPVAGANWQEVEKDAVLQMLAKALSTGTKVDLAEVEQQDKETSEKEKPNSTDEPKPAAEKPEEKEKPAAGKKPEKGDAVPNSPTEGKPSRENPSEPVEKPQEAGSGR